MSDIKLKVIPLFPSSIIPVSGVRLDKASGRWTFAIDYSQIIPLGYTFVPSPTQQLLVWDSFASNYFRIGSDSLVRVIVTTPAALTALTTDPVGHVVGTLSVQNGWGTYTFTLTTNPGGKYQIVGNQLQIAAPLTAGTDTIAIQANNGAGDIINLTTAVTVSGPIVYVPTYYIYGF